MLASKTQLEAAEAALQALAFRQEPFEWVYEGFKPLLLPHVVSSR